MQSKTGEQSLDEAMPFSMAESYYPFFLNAGLLPSPSANIGMFRPIYTAEHDTPSGLKVMDGQLGIYGGANANYDYNAEKVFVNPYLGATYRSPLFGGEFFANASAAPNQRPSFGIGWRATF